MPASGSRYPDAKLHLESSSALEEHNDGHFQLPQTQSANHSLEIGHNQPLLQSVSND
jgi:hypothetical protein